MDNTNTTKHTEESKTKTEEEEEKVEEPVYYLYDEKGVLREYRNSTGWGDPVE